MWHGNWREEIWKRINQIWDIVIIGGGITGAGILREASRLGLKALLVEQRDFAWGTSSRSSKLVHGGLRYLKEGQLSLTRAAVREREKLIADGPGLIDPLGFLLATYKGDHPGRLTYKAGLSIYDLLALHWSHRYYSADDFKMLAPHISPEGLSGGFRYGDAQTDDARLVLRVILEAVAEGGTALNYVTAEKINAGEGAAAGTKKRKEVKMAGVQLRDNLNNRVVEVRTKVLINATGAWADRLRTQIGAAPRIRPLRGSHLIFTGWRFPMAQAMCILHPLDNRPVFIFPWEGITLVGTTDIDHDQSLNEEPAISPEEVAYLMAAITSEFPSLQIDLSDIISTFSGIRPVIGSGKADPSKESRDHAVWEEGDLFTVTGGKLTTFRLIAFDTMRVIRHRLPGLPPMDLQASILDKIETVLNKKEDAHKVPLNEALCRRLLGRYGAAAQMLLNCSRKGETEIIPGSSTIWAELRWAARAEGVVHLDDLLLRRVRLGMLLPRGAEEHLPRIKIICQQELGWDEDRWQLEEKKYLSLWSKSYSLPQPLSSIPDWRIILSAAGLKRRGS